LVNRRPVDSIIYEFALNTISLFFEVANDDVDELATTIIAWTFLSDTQTSGNGLFGLGAEPSLEQFLVFKKVDDTLNRIQNATARGS
jgi:hypothetical protein